MSEYISKYRWRVLAIMFLGAFINYIDRTALPIAAPFVMKEFGLDAGQMGIVFSSFFITYPIFCFIGGYFSDIWGPKKTLGYAMILWSLFAGAPAIAFGFISLIVFRIGFGAGEGPVGSVTNKMVSNWFPSSERAKAKGISDSGMSLGAAISGPIIGFTAYHFGWKVSFIALTILGLIWTFLWWHYVEDTPRQHKKVSPEEVALIEGGQQAVKASDEVKIPFKYYMKQPLVLAVAISFFAANYITYFFMNWFPSYLVIEHNLSIREMSIVSVIPWALAALGFIVGGTVSDSLVKKFKSAIAARKWVIAVGLVIIAISISLCGYVSSAVAAVTLMSIGVFFVNFITPCFWAIIQDSIQSSSVGRVGGFVHFISNIAGVFAPSITGFIVNSTGHFTSAFLVAGGLSVVGAVLVSILAKPIHYEAETPVKNTVHA